MRANEYQHLSSRTVNTELSDRENIMNMVFGIAGETGEVTDILKKHLFQNHELDITHVEEEIGDVMFYIANLCNFLKIDLGNCMWANIEKLRERYPDGFSGERSVNREVKKDCYTCKWGGIVGTPCYYCYRNDNWEAK